MNEKQIMEVINSFANEVVNKVRVNTEENRKCFIEHLTNTKVVITKRCDNKVFKRQTKMLGCYLPRNQTIYLFSDVAEIMGTDYITVIKHEMLHYVQHFFVGGDRLKHDVTFRKLAKILKVSGKATMEISEESAKLVRNLK